MAGKRIHIDEVEFFLDWYPTWTSNELADRLGVSKKAVQHALARHGRGDLLARLRRNAIAAGMTVTTPKATAA